MVPVSIGEEPLLTISSLSNVLMDAWLVEALRLEQSFSPVPETLLDENPYQWVPWGNRSPSISPLASTFPESRSATRAHAYSDAAILTSGSVIQGLPLLGHYESGYDFESSTPRNLVAAEREGDEQRYRLHLSHPWHPSLALARMFDLNFC